MATNNVSGVIQHLRRTVLRGEEAGLTDGQLLGCFLEQRDEVAFAGIVRRHGPMVWGVCRRILPTLHDAEDAFQATFLVLVRKAATIVPREKVANWLYGVARQTALKARATTAKLRTRERQVTEMPEPEAVRQDLWHDLLPVLDQELSQMPDKYRVPIVLCDLEGKTRKEAARQMGWPEGTMAGRLARARALLAKRLARHGVVLSGESLAALLAVNAASAGVPATVASSTIKAATLVAAGPTAAAGVISAQVAALTDGVVKAMLLTKLKITAAIVLCALAVTAVGAGLIACRTQAGEPGKALPRAGREKAEEQRVARLDVYGDPLPEGALVRLGTTRLRHEGFVQTLFFMPGDKAVVAFANNGFWMWQVPGGKLIRTPGDGLEVMKSKYATRVSTAAVSANGKLMAIATGVGEMEIWDLSANKRIAQMECFHPTIDAKGRQCLEHVCAMAFLPGNKVLATGAWNGDGQSMRLWDVATGKELFKVESSLADYGQTTRGVAFAPNRRIAAVGSLNGVVRLWDLETGKSIRDLKVNEGKQPKDREVKMVFSADGQKLVTAATENDNWITTITIWDVPTGKQLIRLNHEDQTHNLQLSPDGKTLANSAWGSKAVQLWNAETGEKARTLTSSEEYITHMDFSSDGKTLVAGGSAQTLQMWDVPSGKSLSTMDGMGRAVEAVAFSPDGKRLACCGKNAVLVWDIASSKLCLRLENATQICALAFSPDGKVLAGAHTGFDRSVMLWDAVTGKRLPNLSTPTPTTDACSLVFSPDGKTLAAARRNLYLVELWQVATGQYLHRLKVSEGYGENPAMTFATDKRLLSIHRGSVKTWNAVTGKQLHHLKLDLPGFKTESRTAALSSDGRTFASQDLQTSTSQDLNAMVRRPPLGARGKFERPRDVLRLWEVASGRERLVFSGDGSGVQMLALSPDGRLLATRNPDEKVVRLWDVTTGKQLHQFTSGHGVTGTDVLRNYLSFAPDGKTLASGNEDTTILIWDVRPWLRRDVRAAALTPDEVKALWSSLADTDTAKAYQTLWKLVAASDQAVPLLAELVRPGPAVDPKRVTRLLTDLDSDDFQVRSQAQKDLEKMAEGAEPFLRQALKDKPTLEARRRMEELLGQIEDAFKQTGGVSPKVLRLLRGVEALERIGTPAARQALQKVAEGWPDFNIGAEAKAALGRLHALPTHSTVP